MSIYREARRAFRERAKSGEDGLEKQALLRAGLVMGGSLAAAAAIAGASALHERITRDRDFHSALRESPRARKKQATAYKHFMTLRRINRSLSKDPLVSAGYMNKAMSYESEGIDPSLALALSRPGEKHDRGSIPSNTFQTAKIIGSLVD